MITSTTFIVRSYIIGDEDDYQVHEVFALNILHAYTTFYECFPDQEIVSIYRNKEKK